ncbi:hypothetical protein OS493_007293 [Desmophyllum pertusum]|uniref:Potassium channel domain-containing protein n=1 Tax=Desmophyllum pertusum TaxID=174260 RepID=A0A9X0CUR7_9CNID|nr:hypothetical protein OS493_007293 [Desmophyllum pertusum]
MDPNKKVIAIGNVFIDVWPLLLLSAVMMIAAGMVMWIMDCRSNRTEFPRSFFRGAPEGIWWAFVTSTTVGYGDRCPRGVLSRVFAIAWTMCGLVIIAILTGKIATVLTDFGYAGPYISLYGAEVAAIVNNSDFRLGVRKNARMNTVRNYMTYEEISQALGDKEVKGALDRPRLRLQGQLRVVLAGHSMKLEKCFTGHIKAHAESVFKNIEENVKILREPDQSPGEQQSTGLFDANSSQFITAVIIFTTLLALAWVLGIIYEIRRKKTSKVLKQSRDLKKEMFPILECFLTRTKEKMKVISKRHRQERCHVMRVEKEHDQQAATAVNKYYQVLSLRDITQEWSPRPTALSVKSMEVSLTNKKIRTIQRYGPLMR